MAKWLDGDETFRDEGKIKASFDEYPKKRIYYFEGSPSHMLLARSASIVYEKERSGFDIIKRFSIMKTLSSPEEEFYFFNSVVNSKINFRRFHEGIFEFECIFCEGWHKAILLNEIMYEEESKD